ncbi:MAG TPA: Uma2 family endonuclease [Bryobacteraceae bacterium]|nr:Uma2 family endonuclease [Bryobacteraceae bacterium]
MASLPNTRGVSYEEWLEMPEAEDGTEEVVDGQIIFMPPAKLVHALIVHNIQWALQSQLDVRTVFVLTGSYGLIIRKAPLTSRDPDIVVIRKEGLAERDGYIHSAPQLVVEVMSPSNRPKNRVRLRQDYASLGVPEYWEVWPEERSVEVLYLENGRYHSLGLLLEGTLQPHEFPNVQIDISRIWPD